MIRNWILKGESVKGKVLMLIYSSHSNLVLAFVAFWSNWIWGEGRGNSFCCITGKVCSADTVLCSAFPALLSPSSQLLHHDPFMPAGAAQGRQKTERSSFKTEGWAINFLLVFMGSLPRGLPLPKYSAGGLRCLSIIAGIFCGHAHLQLKGDNTDGFNSLGSFLDPSAPEQGEHCHP